MNILLGVSGGIAAYKSVNLTSILKKRGYSVDVVMTEAACEFVMPLTFETIAAKPVNSELFAKKPVWKVEHIALAQAADAAILAPASANTLAKLAAGIADNMLTTVFLALECPILLVPAMNTAMLNNKATRYNLNILKERGYHIMESAEGMLACGVIGAGRMPEPSEIVSYFEQIITGNQILKNINILITAGPTREPIDPVRYLSNRSSGKMGYAIAEKAALMGANVTLISGPTSLKPPCNVNFTNILTAEQMYNAVMSCEKEQDIIIMAAAVADYTPKITEEKKIKKSEYLNIELIKTKDILSELGKRKHCMLVGFAAETNNVEKYALNKLNNKNLDMIVANDVSDNTIGFDSADNECTIFTKDKKVNLKKSPKSIIAHQLLEYIAQNMNKYI